MGSNRFVERIERLLEEDLDPLVAEMREPIEELAELIVSVEQAWQQTSKVQEDQRRDGGRLTFQADDLQKQCDRWYQRAQAAVADHDDQGARSALQRKMELRADLRAVEETRAQQERYIDQLERLAKRLKARLEDLRLRQEIAQLEAERGKAQAKINKGKEAAEEINSPPNARKSQSITDQMARLKREVVDDQIAEIKRGRDKASK